ncbi:MAG TPA: hypothetical protein VIE69_03780 [Methylophilaceae bacterium]
MVEILRHLISLATAAQLETLAYSLAIAKTEAEICSRPLKPDSKG